MFSIWSVIQKPEYDLEPWVADLWVHTSEGEKYIFDTVIDSDYQMFQHWLSFYVSAGTEAFALSDGYCEEFFEYYELVCTDGFAGELMIS
jgi:hypothetical protein|tara:strand:- start:3130 stop:3399 length:270 start_codon:yes stop_codon:yes gene_type:complete